jgi:hypothetical protein
MASTSVQAEAIARILERREDSRTRHIDLELTIERPDGTGLVAVGGRWDRIERRYVGPAETGRVVRLQPSQADAGAWIEEWLRRYVTGDWAGAVRCWSVLWRGGRRAGKSHLAILVLIAFALLVPGAIIWAVAAKDDELDEMIEAIAQHLPREWARWRASRKEFVFANGSRIRCLSGFKPDNLKQGKAHLVVLNEAQKMARKAWIQCRGAVADHGGLVIMTENPPDDHRGQWTERLRERIEKGKTTTVDYKFFDNEKNHAINYEALAAIREELGETDDKTYRREVRGEYMPVGDRVLFAWSDAWSVMEVPDDWRDITREFAEYWFNAAGIDTILGCDFDRIPHCAASILRLYLDPHEPQIPKAVQIAEALGEHGEDSLVSALRELPGLELPGAPARAQLLVPRHTLVIADASGRTQEAGKHEQGASSWSYLEAAGFVPRGPGWPVSEKNPSVRDRYSLHNLLLHSSADARRFFIRPTCEWSRRAHREYPIVNGQPKRRDEHAHMVDATGYPLWALFGRDRRALDWVPGVSVYALGPSRPYSVDPKRRQPERDDPGSSWAGTRSAQLSDAKRWGKRGRW